MMDNKDKTTIMGALMIGLVMISATAVLPSAAAQQDNKIPEKNKEFVQKINAIFAQKQGLEDQLMVASKAHDKSKIKELWPQYQKLEDQLNATLSQIPITKVASGQMYPPGFKPKEITSDPKISAGSGTVFRMSGIHFGCDWNMDWASGSGKAYTGTPWAYLFVQTPPTVSSGFWPNCDDQQYTGKAIVDVLDATTRQAGQTSGTTYDVHGNLQNYVNQWVKIPPPLTAFVQGHDYYVTVIFEYKDGSDIRAYGSFTAW